jgi:transposase
MPKPGPRSTYRYSDEFKATAVKLSQLPGVLVNDVAVSLAIHPNMLTLWRKREREGLIVTKGVKIERDVAAELKELRRVKKEYEQLKLEHEILKKPSRSLPLERGRLCLHRALPRNLPSEDAVPAV